MDGIVFERPQKDGHIHVWGPCESQSRRIDFHSSYCRKPLVRLSGRYTATEGALNPVAAALLPSTLVGLTVFVIAWCAVYGWRYVESTKAKLIPQIEKRTALKRLVPDIESCLFF